MADPRFVLITTDTLRYDFLDERHAPNIAGLADRGVSFEKAYSTGSGTSTAFPGIMASALPLDHGYRGLNDSHESVAERLRSQGVRTVGVTSSSHASSLFDYDRGFDDFREDPSYRESSDKSVSVTDTFVHRAKELAKKNQVTKRVGSFVLEKLRRRGLSRYPYHRAEKVTHRAKAALSEGGPGSGGEFVWIHYMEPHSPYYPPDDVLDEVYDGDWTKRDVHNLLMDWYEDRRPLWDGDEGVRMSDEEVEVLLEFYRAQIRYLDREVGDLLDWMDGQAMLDDATVVLTSDHGDEFFDHGDFGHRQKLYDELIHVPFVILDGDHTGTVTDLVSHLDIAPTACDVLDREPAAGWRGRSLMPLVRGESWETHGHVLAELCHRSVEDGYGGDVRPDEAVIAVVTNDWKFILNRQKGSEELYSLEADGIDEDDVASQNPEIAEELGGLARERLDEVNETSREKEELSDEVRDRLHELGYTGE